MHLLPFHLAEILFYYMSYSEGLDSCQRSLIWHQHGVTREQGPIKALVSFTLQRNLIASINWACAVHTFLAFSWHFNFKPQQVSAKSRALRMFPTRYLCNVNDKRALIGPYSLVTSRWCKIRDPWHVQPFTLAHIVIGLSLHIHFFLHPSFNPLMLIGRSQPDDFCEIFQPEAFW